MPNQTIFLFQLFKKHCWFWPFLSHQPCMILAAETSFLGLHTFLLDFPCHCHPFRINCDLGEPIFLQDEVCASLSHFPIFLRVILSGTWWKRSYGSILIGVFLFSALHRGKSRRGCCSAMPPFSLWPSSWPLISSSCSPAQWLLPSLSPLAPDKYK